MRVIVSIQSILTYDFSVWGRPSWLSLIESLVPYAILMALICSQLGSKGSYHKATTGNSAQLPVSAEHKRQWQYNKACSYAVSSDFPLKIWSFQVNTKVTRKKNLLQIHFLASKWHPGCHLPLFYLLKLQRQVYAAVMDTAVIPLGTLYFHHTENVTVIICLTAHISLHE